MCPRLKKLVALPLHIPRNNEEDKVGFFVYYILIHNILKTVFIVEIERLIITTRNDTIIQSMSGCTSLYRD